MRVALPSIPTPLVGFWLNKHQCRLTKHPHIDFRHQKSFTEGSMAATASRLPNPGPIHPAKVTRNGIKPSVARPIRLAVYDPRDHEAPAILHEPRQYTVDNAKASAVILISGAGGGVSGPAGMLYNKIRRRLSPPFSFRSSIN
jgi:hypothetical protein